MNAIEAAKNLTRAITRAAEEHGRPNTFGFGELEALYGGPPAMLAGRAARLCPDHLTAIGAAIVGGRIAVT